MLAIVRDVTEERPRAREQIELREALLAARSAIERAAGSLVRDSEADVAASRALGLIYKLEHQR